MTLEEAVRLHRMWYGTHNEKRKPPQDRDLQRWLEVDRATWTEAERLVAERREQMKDVEKVFICSPGKGCRMMFLPPKAR